ncbi:MAG: hypothetical protein QOK20_2380 [Acidimicrobiaceae bacterium]|nr:hypothetical protein [Acidimicrobiaceae bacterium]
MRNACARAVAVAMLGAISLVITAPASNADVNIWNNANFDASAGSAHLGNYYADYTRLRYIQNGRNVNDTVSSLNVDSSAYLWETFWTDTHCRGTGYSVQRGTSRSYVGSRFNDTFSSHGEEWRQSGC